MISILFLVIVYVFLHKPLHDFLLGYSTQNLDWLHEEEDIFGSRIKNQLKEASTKYKKDWTYWSGKLLIFDTLLKVKKIACNLGNRTLNILLEHIPKTPVTWNVPLS